MKSSGALRLACGVATFCAGVFGNDLGANGLGVVLIVGGYLLCRDGLRMWRGNVIWLRG